MVVPAVPLLLLEELLLAGSDSSGHRMLLHLLGV